MGLGYTDLNDKERLEMFKGNFLCQELRELFHNGEIGGVFSTQGIYGDRYSIFTFVKLEKKLIKGYCISVAYSSYRSAQNPTPTLTITDKCITYNHAKHKWHNSGFSLKSMLRNDTLNLNLVDVNWIRKAYVVKAANDKQAIKHLPYYDLKDMTKGAIKLFFKDSEIRFDWKGNLLPSSEENKRYTKEILQSDRDSNNANARARYQNTKAMKRLDFAKENNDWSNIEINDVFRLRNVAQRTEVMEHFGSDKVIESLKHTVLHEDIIDGRPYRLLDVEIPTIEITTSINNGLYLEMKNPSTGEMCFEGVPNIGRWDGLKEPTVQCALAWRDNDKFEKTGYNKPVVLT